MPTITDTGITGISLLEYKEELENAFQVAFGSSIDLDPQTPQGQIIGILSLLLSQTDDVIVQDFQTLNIFNAAGSQLDGYGAAFNIERLSATSTLVNVIITGVPSTIIPEGAQAKTVNGDVFENLNDATLDGAGSAAAVFKSVEAGPIPANENSLTEIVTIIAGWETINNLTAGILGVDAQDDNTYRRRYFNTLNKNALATVAAIQARLNDLSDVIAAKVFENDTSENKTIQNVTLLPHSIAAVVNGGVAQDIGQSIYDSKTVGAGTEGANTSLQTAVVVDSVDGLETPVIYYYPLELIVVSIILTISVYDDIPEIPTAIRNAILNYFDGSFSSEIEPISIGDILYQSRLFTPINSVQGFDVVTLIQEIQGSGTPQTIIIPDLNQQLVTTSTDISISIV